MDEQMSFAERLLNNMPPIAYTGSRVIVRRAFEGMQLGLHVELSIIGRKLQPVRLDYDPNLNEIAIWLKESSDGQPEYICHESAIDSVRTSPEPLND